MDSIGSRLLIADTYNYDIRSYALNTGLVTTFVGVLGVVTGIFLDKDRNLYIAEFSSGFLRRTTTAGVISTLASGLGCPYDVVLDDSGNAYVTDYCNNIIRKVDTTLSVSVLAGTVSASGNLNGQGTFAKFGNLCGITIDSNGLLYAGDCTFGSIRTINSNGLVATFAGSGTPGYTNGIGTYASFSCPARFALSSFGSLYVADTSQHLIREISITSQPSIQPTGLPSCQPFSKPSTQPTYFPSR
jgi:sugar lactone lactonase YvrE